MNRVTITLAIAAAFAAGCGVTHLLRPAYAAVPRLASYRRRHSGAREARTRNLEIPGLVLTDHPGMTASAFSTPARCSILPANEWRTP